MIKKYIMIIFILTISANFIFAKKLKGNQILLKADQYRGLKQEFNILTYLEYHYNNERKGKANFKSYVKSDRRSITKVLKPRRMKGRIILVTDQNMWVYIPRTRFPIRISPMQRFMGPASYGDVARLTFAGDYDAKIQSIVKVNGKNCYFLKLKGIKKGIAYTYIDYYVEVKSFKPMKAIYYAKSGRPLKEAVYTKYIYHSSSKRVGVYEVIITDLVNTSHKVLFRYTRPKRGALPNAYFQKNYMKRIR